MTTEILKRHIILLILASTLAYVFWLSSKLSIRAFGDTTFVFLCITLLIGPVSRLYMPIGKLIPWRRYFGIWTFLLASTHVFLVTRIVNFDIISSLGLQYLPEQGRYIRLVSSGITLANLMGFTALAILSILVSTSSDIAVRKLGSASWKWLHRFVYVAFYLIFFHAFHYIFLNYMSTDATQANINQNSFSMIFLLLGASVIVSQLLAFIKTIKVQGAK